LGASAIVVSALSIFAAADVGAAAPAAEHRDEPFGGVRQFVLDHSGGVASRLSAEPAVAVQSLSSCYDKAGVDPTGDSSGPDIVTYQVGSDCATWALDVVTESNWRARELDVFGMRIDVDYNAATGCSGGDYLAAAFYDAGLVGAMVRTPSCDESTWTYVAGIDVSRTTQNAIALRFPVATIKNDESFRWYLGLSSVDGGVDLAPNSSWLAVNPEATAPTAPRSLTARAGARHVELHWRAPQSPGGTKISDYVVQRSADGGRTWRRLKDGIRTDRGVTVRRLTNGQRYRFRVAAANMAGRGPWSAAVTVVPAAVPSTPRRLTATGAHRAVRLTWLAPASNGGAVVRDYVVQRSADRGQTWRTVRDGVRTRRAATVQGLRSRTRYVFRVAAVNRIGRGPWSAVVRAAPR
jgi:hypothetical protein